MPREDVPEIYQKRIDPDRPAVVECGGGSPETETAVRIALAWLAENQETNGRWDARRHGGGRERSVLGHDREGAGARADTGVTGLALLAFLGAGHTHFSGQYRQTVQAGLDHLVRMQAPDGNLAGDGSLEPRNGGITKLGKATIERIESEKLLLDLSHGGARTMAEAAAFAKRPLVISHTGARALTDHPRNTADETMKAVADKGGVVGVYWMPFLTLDSHPKGADLIAHIEHVARVAGEDHIGIGTDNGVLPQQLDAESKKKMDEWTQQRIERGIAAPGEAVGVYPLLEDYNSIDRYRRLAGDLAGRGWSEARLEKLFGGNFLRVYKDAWGG